MTRPFAIAGLMIAVAACGGRAAELIVHPPVALANGTLQVLEKPGSQSGDVLIHFHGARETVATAYARSRLSSVLVIVNFPGLSTAYSKPFVDSPTLLDTILETASAQTEPAAAPDQPRWRRISLSSFSAGYGAVREILKQDKADERISAIVAADSIYAGIDESDGTRQVDRDNMRGFLRFAQRATQNEKTFILSHSAQPTPYASTTETADYLLRSLNLERQDSLPTQSPVVGLRQVTLAGEGRFSVWGFTGESERDHMQHLHHIDLLWNMLATDPAKP